MSLEGNKVVSGSQAVAMEPGLFRFELIDQNNTKKIDTAKNDELGVYSFDDIDLQNQVTITIQLKKQCRQ